MRSRRDRHKFGNALHHAEHGDLGIAERDEAGVEFIGAGAGHVGLVIRANQGAYIGLGASRRAATKAGPKRSAFVTSPALPSARAAGRASRSRAASACRSSRWRRPLPRP